jgi:endo-beta-N-acetylglucosaminidase D
MEESLHSMTDLFTQLGLPSKPLEIQAFIESHRPLDASFELNEAPFWTASQADFLREQVQEDADWAGIIDRLDSGLRQLSP